MLEYFEEILRNFMGDIEMKKMPWWQGEGRHHFEYDGFEMGEYKKGDVTIFDRVKKG